LNDAVRVVLAHGAIRAAPVLVKPVMAYADQRLCARFSLLPFTPTHAVIAVFAGRPEICAKGGDYSGNKARLEKACNELRVIYPAYRFYVSANGYPLPAVQAARLAGLGGVGLNGLLHVPGFGSSVTIGALLTDIPFLHAGAQDGGYCALCGECVKCCPVGAITYTNGVRSFSREKCLSHLRQKEDLPLQRPGYYGCDICQDVCPMNKH